MSALSRVLSRTIINGDMRIQLFTQKIDCLGREYLVRYCTYGYTAPIVAKKW